MSRWHRKSRSIVDMSANDHVKAFIFFEMTSTILSSNSLQCEAPSLKLLPFISNFWTSPTGPGRLSSQGSTSAERSAPPLVRLWNRQGNHHMASNGLGRSANLRMFPKPSHQPSFLGWWGPSTRFVLRTKHVLQVRRCEAKRGLNWPPRFIYI